MPVSTHHFSFSLILLLSLFGKVWAEDFVGDAQQREGNKTMGAKSGLMINKRAVLTDRKKMFELVDIDDDRKLTFAEFANTKRLQHMEPDKRRKLFVFLDQDKDGFLQIEEIHSPVPKWMKMARKGFPRFDQDKDGGLNDTEFAEFMKLSKMSKIDPVSLFQRLDRNKNGVIEFEELGASIPRLNRAPINFMAYDNNSSGGVDYEEYSKIPMLCKWSEQRRRKLFQRIDADLDGEINQSELSSMPLGRRGSPGFVSPKRKALPREQ